MLEIKLSHNSWRIDERRPLGPAGGFGEVFRGEGAEGPVAIKRLKITADAAAHREMKIGEALARRPLARIVPIFDFGQDANSDRYYLVMPICDYSLQYLLGKSAPLNWETARSIIIDIITGLEEVGDIVHRDLKPSNILQHEGHWKIADFGIAKFVEDSTSLATLRGSLTPTYAAPEQWRGERPTKSTDIYALGCVIHAMINGRPPFLGSMEEIREAHLNFEPPSLKDTDARLEGFVRLMLRKAPNNRPSLARARTVVSDVISRPLSARGHALAAAGARVLQEEVAAETARNRENDAQKARQSAAQEAAQELKGILNRLLDEIKETSEIASKHHNKISIGQAELAFDAAQLVDSRFSQSNWDVLSYSAIKVGGPVDRKAYHEPELYFHPATLVYAKRPTEVNYRWLEISFFNWSATSGLVALQPKSPEFDLALSKVMSGWGIAFGPVPIDGEDEDIFKERWIKLFTKAVRKRLVAPNNLPLSSTYYD